MTPDVVLTDAEAALEALGELNGKTVDKVQVPWGKAMKPEHIAGKVGKDVEAVHWVSNESSTGVFSDSVALAKEVRAQNPDSLVFVDAVTSSSRTSMPIPSYSAPRRHWHFLPE